MSPNPLPAVALVHHLTGRDLLRVAQGGLGFGPPMCFDASRRGLGSRNLPPGKGRCTRVATARRSAVPSPLPRRVNDRASDLPFECPETGDRPAVVPLISRTDSIRLGSKLSLRRWRAMTALHLAEQKARILEAALITRAREGTLQIVAKMGKRGFSRGSPFVQAIHGAFVEIYRAGIEQLEEDYLSAAKAGADVESVRAAFGRAAEIIRDVMSRMAVDEGKRYGPSGSPFPAGGVDRSLRTAQANAEADLGLKLGGLERHATVLSRASTPVPDVAFVRNDDCRGAAVVAAAEASRCLDAGAPNAAVVMVGSALEAVLPDVLLENQNRAAPVASRGKGEADLRKWDLDALIVKAVKAGLLKDEADKLTSWIRSHRNLIHPGRMLRNGQRITEADARAAVSILAVVCEKVGQ